MDFWRLDNLSKLSKFMEIAEQRLFDIDNIEERLETFVMFLGRYRGIRYPLYKFLTSKFGIPIIKIRQYIKSKKYRRKP